jgi:hypothetical protein
MILLFPGVLCHPRLRSKMRIPSLRRLLVPVLALSLVGGVVVSASTQVPTETITKIEIRGDYQYITYVYTFPDGRTETVIRVIPIRSIPTTETEA